MYDVRSRISAGLVHARKALQPICERNMLAAIKLADVVIGGQQFDRREGRLCLWVAQLPLKN